MNIPSLPVDKVLKEEGTFADPWQLCFEQLVQQLQEFLSNEGYVLPEQPTTTIAQLTSLRNGLLIDSTTNQLKVNLNGVWKTVTVT